ncbi:MAG: RNA polymerase sigma-70 factor [Tannerella sp.]|jgi:RNA polymerase sigma-70 factor (ECF subfamily)|nr:RNA polymerase sigma-70 factor [Tannerella sp.]
MTYSQCDFEKIYKLYYPKLFGFARNYIPVDEDAENIVQDVFLILWEKRNEIEISYTLTSWLFTLIKNKCLNFLRHKLIEDEYKVQIQEELSFKLYALESLDYSYQSEKELEDRIRQAIDALPERCREIFIKNRMEGMKYKEIAEELSISVNTVENQMVTALKKLRIALKDFLPLFLFLVK